jgi:GntR family transcriptional regulator / MocR family aminotransferase
MLDLEFVQLIENHEDSMILQLDGRGALTEQLARAIKAEILEGRYAANAWLPATRSLAVALGISRNTVIAAYELLCVEQLAVAHPGIGTRVTAATAQQKPARPGAVCPPQSRFGARIRQLEPITLAGGKVSKRYDLQYGSPRVRPQLFVSWRRKQIAAAMRASTVYPSAQGLESLRGAIADYLVRRRGVMCTADEVIVVGGTQQALTLTARVLVDEGQEVIIEDPHYQYAYHGLFAHGARLSPVRVDADGLVTKELPSSPPRLIVVTPAHQFPSGVVMSLERRVELLNYAAKHKCWVFEDDYDGEFHYDSRPTPALRSLDIGERVIYSGTFSKTLFPGLRLGYVVCPPALHQDMRRAKAYDDLGCSSIEQTTLATFLANRLYEKHLRQSLIELRDRRRALLTGITRHLGPHIEYTTSSGGMHAVVWFRQMTYAELDRLLPLAAARGLGLYPIHPYYRKRPAKPGLMLGFAGLSPGQITNAMALLGECVRDTVDSAP